MNHPRPRVRTLTIRSSATHFRAHPGLIVTAATLWVQAIAQAATSQPTDWLSDAVSRHGVFVGLLASFVGGLALNLTPCVYPMIPVTMAFFGGQRSGNVRHTALLASIYALGISLCYAMLGLLAAKTGVLLGSWLQQPMVLVGVASILVGLSLSMFGVFELRVPQALTRRLGRASAGVWGALGMGLVVGVVAAPCIGPFVLGLLLFIGQTANPMIGFFLLFMLGLGMGLPYIVLGVAANRAVHLPKAGGWLVWIKKALGCVLLGLTLYFIRPLLPARALGIAVSVLLLGSGLYLGWMERTRVRGQSFRWVRRFVGSALVIAAVALAWPQPKAQPAIAWVPYSDAAFAQAHQQQRPILIDVYADWCLPCVELDHVTFRHPDVVEALRTIATFRIDVTREASPEAEALFERSDVYGVPTVLFFDRNGQERRDLRLLGFESPDDFLRRLGQLR